MKAIPFVTACIVTLWAMTLRAGEKSATMPSIAISNRTTEPLLKADQPWEDFCIGYCQVIRMDGRWMMWYASYDHHYRNDSDGFLCYAESTDGLHWAKPELGIISYNGSTHNNIVLAKGVHAGLNHLPAPE